MEDPSRTNPGRIEEVSVLKQRIQELEQSESERKRAEEALRESEERYRYIVETSLEGIWIINEELRTTFVNQRMADMLGYAP